MKRCWPFLVIIALVTFFYHQFFFNHRLPIPSDIITGLYYPFLDYKPVNLPAGIPVQNPLPSDVVSLTYPLRLLSINLIKNHQWPLWNANILSGVPLLADFQSAALYPLNFLYLLTANFPLIWSIQVILQPLLAIFFTYLLLRDYALSRFSSLFGGLVFGFSSFVSIWSQYNTVIHSIIYLPLALLMLKKLPSSNIFGIIFSLSIAFSLYAGNPPVTLTLFLACGLFSLFHYRLHFSHYLQAAFFLVLGLAFASPLLLPGYQIFHTSIRQNDSVAVDNHIKFVPLDHLLTLTTPDFYGHPATLNYWGSGLYDNLTIFVGVIPLFLFVLFLRFFSRENSLSLFVATLTALSLLLIFNNPFSRFIGNLPFLGLSAMVMSRFFTLTSLGVAIGSSIALNHFQNSSFKKTRLLFPLTVTAVFILTPLAIVTAINYFFRHSPLSADPNLITVINTTLIAIRNSVIPLGILLVSLPLVLIPKIPKNFCLLILFLLTTADLYRFFTKYNSFNPPSYLFPTTPVLQYLRTNATRFLREPGEILPSNMWIPYNLKAASGYDTLQSARYNGFISLVNGSTLNSITNRYPEINTYTSPKLNFLGISHFLVLKRNALGIPDVNGLPNYQIKLTTHPLVFQDKSMAVIQNPAALPLIFPVSRYQVATDSAQLNELIDHSDLSTTAIFESDPRLNLGSSLPLLENIQINSQQTTLNTRSATASLLITSQTYDPGWQLFIDRQPTPVLVANYAFMAIPVPPGQHQIKLTYQPPGFYLGLKILFGSLIISVWLILRQLSRRHSSSIDSSSDPFLDQ